MLKQHLIIEYFQKFQLILDEILRAQDDNSLGYWLGELSVLERKAQAESERYRKNGDLLIADILRKFAQGTYSYDEAIRYSTDVD